MEHEAFMRKAERESEIALAQKEVPIGCVLVYQGKVIARGANRTNADSDPLSHAEVVALRSLSKAVPLDQATLYVTCEPCIMCAGIITKMGIGRVYYGCRNERFGGETILKTGGLPGSKTVFAGGILAERAVQRLKEFYRNENLRAPAEKRKSKENAKEATTKIFHGQGDERHQEPGGVLLL
jgi:tRNA-specific adenosine deaminase 2